jgi:Zn-dependent protease
VSDAAVAGAARVCGGCGIQLAPTLLSCPGCGRLAHADRLRALQAEAQALEAGGRYADAVERWRAVLVLLPPDAGQHATVAARIEALSRQAGAAEAEAQKKSWLGKGGAAAGAGALLLWKLKFALVFLLTKAKLLLVGFANLPTLLSMLLSMGVYLSLWGWKFAVGLVLCIYVHEMGHVAALKRLRLPASAPMFIPGLGAFVLLKQHPATPHEDADVGLAGPEWGAAAAVACAAVFWLGGGPFWGALAKVAAWLNLFNLVPFWQLDGGRAFRALDKRQRWMAAASLLGAYLLTRDGMPLMLALVAGWQAYSGGAEKPDRPILARYVFLVAILSFLHLISVPMG